MTVVPERLSELLDPDRVRIPRDVAPADGNDTWVPLADVLGLIDGEG